MKTKLTEIFIDDDNRFELLQELLLEKDREKLQTLNDEIGVQITALVKERNKEYLKQNPLKVNTVPKESLKQEITYLLEPVLEVLYPTIGKMIKKSIINEITKLNAPNHRPIKEINRKLLKNKSIEPTLAPVLQVMNYSEIEEIFIIEKDSGLLKGSYSRIPIVNKDMLSGMLTAIKSFVEDAFFKKGQNLEYIQFETFQISIHNFKTIYIAITTSGSSNPIFNTKVSNAFEGLADIILKNPNLLENEIQLNELLERTFLGITS